MSDPRYFMNDGQISYMDPQCPWMYAAVVISIYVKCDRHADGKYLAEARFHVITVMGGAVMIAVS